MSDTPVLTKDESFTVGALRARFADESMPWTRPHVESLINQIAALTKQRDEGWDNFYRLRKQVAEEKYPGMTQPVRALAVEPPAEPSKYQRAAALEELVRTATEVHRISDRAHEAWMALAAALNEARVVMTQPEPEAKSAEQKLVDHLFEVHHCNCDLTKL